jgi:hypothetical protein
MDFLGILDLKSLASLNIPLERRSLSIILMLFSPRPFTEHRPDRI